MARRRGDGPPLVAAAAAGERGGGGAIGIAAANASSSSSPSSAGASVCARAGDASERRGESRSTLQTRTVQSSEHVAISHQSLADHATPLTSERWPRTHSGIGSTRPSSQT